MANFNLPAVPTTPEGGLAGFFRGTQYNYGLADLDRQFRDSDLQNLRNQNMYENELLDNPNKVANRATDLLKQEEEQSQYRSGLKNRSAVADVNKKEADVTKTNLENKQTEITQAADALNEFVQVAKAQPMAIMHNWDGYMAELAKNKVKVPEGGYSQQNMDILQARALAAQNSLAQLRAKAIAEQKFGFDKEIHKMDNEAAMARTRVMANATENKQPNDPDKRALTENRSDAQAGREVSLSRIVQLAPAYVKNDQVTLEKVTNSEQQAAQVMFGKLKSNPKEFDSWLSKQGLEPSVYKVEGKYDFRSIGKDLAEKSIKGQAIEEAWDQSQRPKTPEKDISDIRTLYPVLANKMEANNKQKGGSTPTSTAKPTVTKFIPPQDVEKVIADNMAAKKGASREWVIKKLKEHGKLPPDWSDSTTGTTPPMASTPVDSHAIPPQTPPMNIDIRNAMNKLNKFVNSKQVDPSSMVD